MKPLFQKQKGFTMSEVLISISVLSFGILLIYNAFSLMIISTYNVSARFTAAYLAQEGIEIIRNLRDNNFIKSAQDPGLIWSEGLTGLPCNEGCIADYKTMDVAELLPYDNQFLGLNNQGFYSYDVDAISTPFSRKIIITPVSETNDSLKVSVFINWTYNERDFSLESVAYLYNWY